MAFDMNSPGMMAPGQMGPGQQPNPYMRAPTALDSVGPNGGGQGSPIPLGQPDANGTTLQQLSSPTSTMDAQKKALLAKALMGAAQMGQGSQVATPVTDLNGILPGQYVGNR